MLCRLLDGKLIDQAPDNMVALVGGYGSVVLGLPNSGVTTEGRYHMQRVQGECMGRGAA